MPSFLPSDFPVPNERYHPSNLALGIIIRFVSVPVFLVIAFIADLTYSLLFICIRFSHVNRAPNQKKLPIRIMHRKVLHNHTTCPFQLPQYAWEIPLDRSFYLGILIVLTLSAVMLLLMLITMSSLPIVLLLLTTRILRLATVVLLVATRVTVMLGHVCRAAGQVDVHTASVLFRGVLESEFLADLLDTGFYLLDVVDGVVAFSYYARSCEEMSALFDSTLAVALPWPAGSIRTYT